MQEFSVGQEVQWLTRPTPTGYLHGIIVQIGPRKIKIKVQSFKTGEWKEKWANPEHLRIVRSSLEQQVAQMDNVFGNLDAIEESYRKHFGSIRLRPPAYPE